MDRGQAPVHRVTGVRHDLVTKPPLVSQQRAHVPEAQKTNPGIESLPQSKVYLSQDAQRGTGDEPQIQ